MAYQYPASGFDQPGLLLSLLGEFWAQLYGDLDTVQAILFARAQREAQAQQNLTELLASTSRYTVPLLHREHWTQLVLKQSEMNSALLALGDPGVLGNQPGSGVLYALGVPVPGAAYEFPLPRDLVECPWLFNRISAPSCSLCCGIDFTVDTARQVLVFQENPFDDSRLPQRFVFDGDGNVVDTECELWLFRGGFDRQYNSRLFGYLLDARLPSTAAFRQYTNAVLDAVVGGTAQAQVAGMVSALTGIPTVLEPQETVEVVVTDSHGLFVATDQNVYRFSGAATPVVSVAQTLSQGAALVDTVQFYEFNQGITPEALLALSIGPSFLSEAYYADLTFADTDVPLQVQEQVDGYTKLSFPLGGWPADVDRFFDDLHARGVAGGKTLANYLDIRANPVGQPGPANLPPTINPLQFLIRNVLRNNASLLIIKAAGLPGNGLGLARAGWLRKIVPPATFLFVLVQLDVPGDTVTMSGPDGNYTESPQLMPGMPINAETVTVADWATEAPTLGLLADFCL